MLCFFLIYFLRMFVEMYLSNFPTANFSAGRVAGTCLLTLIAIAPFCKAPANAQLPTSNSLTVQVSGLKSTDGQVCVSLYDDSEGFPNEPEAVIAKQCVETSSAASFTFLELSSGTYAVSVLHDEDRDERLAQGTFGIPMEGFGFSRNPVIRMSAPEFYETAVFVVGSTTTEIEMIYF